MFVSIEKEIMASEASLHVLAPVYGQPHFEGEAEPPYKRARPDEEGLDPTLTREGGALDTLSEESHDQSAASSTATPGETTLLPAEGLAPPQAADEEAAPAEAHEEGAQLMGREEVAEAARQHELSTTPPASTVVPEPALLPVTSIRHIMKRAMGGEQDAITDETVSVVQRCTTEFVSLVVSEARVRVAKEGRTSVTYSDIATALNALGFKQFQEPLKAHMTLHYGGSAVKRPPKRQRVEDDAVAHGAVSRCNPIGKALALPPADREGRTPAPASGSMRRQVACGQCDACCRDDCGTCLNCLDKPKFGGSGAPPLMVAARASRRGAPERGGRRLTARPNGPSRGPRPRWAAIGAGHAAIGWAVMAAACAACPAPPSASPHSLSPIHSHMCVAHLPWLCRQACAKRGASSASAGSQWSSTRPHLRRSTAEATNRCPHMCARSQGAICGSRRKAT